MSEIIWKLIQLSVDVILDTLDIAIHDLLKIICKLLHLAFYSSLEVQSDHLADQC